MHTLSASQATAQLQEDRTPYIRLVFTGGYDFSFNGSDDRVVSIEHNEQAYSGDATIILQNEDGEVPDLRGCAVDIGWGDVTTSGNEYVDSPTMWVVSQTETTSPGVLSSKLVLWDIWNIIAAIPIDHVGDAPDFYFQWEGDTTPFDIMYGLFAAVSVPLSDYSDDDGITDTMTPWFDVNAPAYETYQGALRRIIQVTKKYIRIVTVGI